MLHRERRAAFFLPATVLRPCPGQQDKGSRESRGGTWSLDRLGCCRTCLVNINRSTEIARGTGREMRVRLCPVPQSLLTLSGAAPLLAGAKWLGLALLCLCQSIITEQHESSFSLAVFFYSHF